MVLPCGPSAYFFREAGPARPSAVQGPQAGRGPHPAVSANRGAPAAASSLPACRIRRPAPGLLSNPQGLAEGPRSAEVFTCLKMYQAINRSCSQSPAILGWFFPYFLPPFVSFNKEEREERGTQSPLSALISDPQRARSRSFSQTLRQGSWAAGEEADCRGDTRPSRTLVWSESSAAASTGGAPG